MADKKKVFKRKSVVQRYVERTIKGDKMNPGAYMWVIQRITGPILLFYFILHLFTLSSILNGEKAFDHTMELLHSPLIKVLELVLLWVVAFHALNGVRLILLSLFVDINQKVLAYCFSLATIIFLIISIPFIW